MVNELTVLTTIHILAAAIWVGGAVVLNIAMALAARETDPAPKVAAFRLAGWLGNRFFLPVALVVLGSGIWLTTEYYDFDLLWVNLGMIGLITVLTVGVGYLAPQGRRAAEAIASGAGPPPPGTRNWVPIVGRLNTLLLIAVLVIMVIKPT
jgi:uncharacterized membrane protein